MLERNAWSLRCGVGGMKVWTRESWPVETCGVEGGGVALGEVFARVGARVAPAGRRSQAQVEPLEEKAINQAAQRWSDSCWGPHVVVWPRPNGAGLAIYREATGAREAFVWSRDGLTVVSSALEGSGVEMLRPRLTVRSDRVAAMLGCTSEIGGDLALEGLEAAAPGELLRPGGLRRTMWSPARIARCPGLAGIGDAELAAELRTTIAGSLGAVADLGRPLIAEISGGLDSAITACELVARPGLRAWLHVHAGEDEGDERGYARAVAAHLGVTLTERVRAPMELCAAVLDGVGLTARPAFSALDAGYEATVLAAVSQTQAWGVVTGQGGDTVFYSMAAAVVAADRELRRQPQRRRALIRGLAAELGTSIWRVGGRSRAVTRGRPGAWAPLFGAHAQITDVRDRAPTHPWMRSAQQASVAKQIQIEGLAYNLLAYTACRRTKATRLFHGPMLQPVVEFCLRAPAFRLVQGGRDRGLARGAYAGRLPGVVLDRRSKGDLTRVYGRELAKALPVVRERLLEGGLRRMALIDVPRLEERLTPEALMWWGGYGDIMELLAIETWVSTVGASGGSCEANA